ncbi:Heterokaryon incompatibility protein S [Lasiodiplodia theobromae]|uniref:Heterokaryon incompatibility protein S n=1 Tax=Lasiodiplodia theobromae TaxID=45133 RepID=A0A5N5CWP8_9PEZI|nr:Heterokaryon incompatibility protein S [Lasiodiplodia theobromae]
MVGVSEVVTLLDTALACFEGVQIARSLDKDLNSHRIKLDIIQLRLSRWGEAAGLYPSSGSASDSSTTDLTKADGQSGATNDRKLLRITDEDKAKHILEDIAAEFVVAQKEAAKMQPQQPQEDGGDGMIDPAKDLDSPTRTLRANLRAVLKRRWVKLVDVTHSVQWAFYKKQQFDAFVTEISGHISSLESLFPAADEAERAAKERRLHELGAAECADIRKVYLKVLGAVTKEDECDPYLNAAVDEALKPRETAKGGTTINMRNDGYNYGQQIGQNLAPQEGFNIGTTNHYGNGTTNHYGGRN